MVPQMPGGKDPVSDLDSAYFCSTDTMKDCFTQVLSYLISFGVPT